VLHGLVPFGAGGVQVAPEASPCERDDEAHERVPSAAPELWAPEHVSPVSHGLVPFGAGGVQVAPDASPFF